MLDWKKKFDQNTLERGKASYLNKRVVDLKEIPGGYEAAVLGRERFPVTVKVKEDSLGRMSCRCSVARSGRNCEHMAAVLYALEAMEKAAEEKISEEMLLEKWRQMDEALRLEEERKRAESAPRKMKRQETAEENHRLEEAPRKMKRQETAEGNHRLEEAPRKMKRQETAEEKHRREEELKKAAEEKQAEEQEREARRLAREQRKAERARQQEEQKRKAEEARRLENEKRRKEEARREEIRKQKAEEARRKAEKRQKELEAQRMAAEKRRKEEEARQAAERRRKEEEARQAAERRRKEEEARQAAEKRRKEEEARREAERQQQEEKSRKEEEDRRMEQERRNTEYTLLGDSWEDNPEEPEISGSSASIEKLINYNYFNGTAIKKSMDIPRSAYLEGNNLIHQGKLQMDRVISGYDRVSGQIMGQADATAKLGNTEFSLRMFFNRTAVTGFNCGCPKCRKDYWFMKKTDCAYKAGLLTIMEDYLNTHNMGDATDMKAQRLLSFYQEKRVNRIKADVAAKEGSLQLLPRLTRKDGKLSVSFKVGEKKLFVIKKLDVFCRNVKNSETDTYGTNTEINHSITNFTEKGKGWIRFINRIVREELEFQQRLMESRYYFGYQKSGVGSDLNLFGWRLDEFFRQMADETIEYEDKDAPKKKKEIVSCAECNPKVTMRISAKNMKEDSEFHGIRVEGSLPDMYFGTDTAYFIGNEHLNRVDSEFLKTIEPLTSLAEGDRFSFDVGRNNMSEFYQKVLPQLREVVDVAETEPEKFRSYLMPEVHFTFYLDAEKENVTCRIYARYGDREVFVPDILTKHETGAIEKFRDVQKEEEVLFQTMQWLPEVDPESGELHCGSDEELAYRFMESGTEKLMEMGEVRCTKRFLGYRSVRKVKVSVGVSLSSDLLELDISTDDIPREELLDILNSYRAKKKYYRLKEGSFINLDDPSLTMLAELMDTMHLKPKELLKGKMHLPIYRTLYLDKMLEENESIYSSRSSRFKEMVKGFKTVKDADFEEPQSLSKIMRNYQKNGYKWLRTLETWQFGGILADDMGLGKTLQVISVLLAAKQEGRTGTSLVVSPASLIFNWGEEFQRFAPELKISLITGTQEERQEKIEAYRESDVLVTSYDLLKRDIAFYEEKEFQYEIIDEAQYIKNHTTAAAKAVKVIHSRIRYALTGTPIENRLSELWSIFDYLMPGFLYGYDVFKREMETPIVKNNDETAMKRLQKMTGPFILRRLKEDVLKDLPEKLEECRYVRLEGEQQTLYDAQVLHMKEHISGQNDEEFNKNKMLILAELMRLRQICCDPSLCFENYTGEAAKLEACLQLIQSAMDGGHRMLVFSQFTSMLEILQKNLDSAGISYYTITGSTSKEKRLQMVKEFNEGDTPVFLISLKAGGVGLNLTGADVVIHYDPWWNLAVQNQATDRAHRIGQTKKVTVYKLIAKNTIEEKIEKLQETKKNLADQVIGGETGQLGSMSREEIMALLEV